MKEDERDLAAAPAMSRRQMLLKLGLAATVTYAAPVLLGLGGAHASSGGSGGSGGRGGGGQGSRGFSSPRRRPRQQRARRPAPRPEIVVAAPSAADIDVIAAQGYALLARDRLDLIGADIARFGLPANRTLEQARAEILQLVPAALFDPNHVYRTSELACGAEGCAAFEMTGWMSQSCPAGATIGMIDTSVNVAHEALAGVDVELVPVIGAERRASSRVHGTAVAVLLAGRADSRTPGLLAGARLVAAEAFHADAAGRDAADAFDVARALDRLAASEAKVVNLSFAGPANLVLERVVRAVLGRDIVLVAAAGNSGPRAEPLYPAAYDGVIAVTAVDRRLRAWRQATSGGHIDFAAPGVRLWTAASVRGGRFRSGTSYAAPFVTAAIAAARAADPHASGAQAVERLAAGAADLGPAGRDDTFGWGLVQAPEACAEDGGMLLPASGGRS